MAAAGLGQQRGKAPMTARSARDGRGRATCRRNTATWWRGTRISASLATSERTSNAVQDLILQKIRYTRRNVTIADHAEAHPTVVAAGRRGRPSIGHSQAQGHTMFVADARPPRPQRRQPRRHSVGRC
jgi:hypothetical protein